MENEAPGPFKWLQAVDFPEFAFVITEPSQFFENYDVPVTPEVLESLNLKSPEDGLILLILTVSEKMRSITANLQGPIVINPELMIGRQIVLQVPGYTTRYSLITKEEKTSVNSESSR